MRVKGSEIAKIILATVGVAGILVVAFTAPNVMSAFAPFVKGKSRPNKLQIKKSLDYLSRKGLVTIKKEGNRTVLTLTNEGKEKYHKLYTDQLTLPVSKKWDGKWRVVCFDIPEKYKINRMAFLEKLKELGFVPLQKSILIWPYDCEQEIELLSEAYEILPFVRFMVVERIDKSHALKKQFNLG